jgi:hypothetical protein
MAPRVRRNNKRKNVRNTKRRTRRQAQKKFTLPKPKLAAVKQISNILEVKKFRGLDYDNNVAEWVQGTIEEGTMPINSAGLSFMPDSFYRMQFQPDIIDQTSDEKRELSNDCIEGNSLFSKYLQVKCQIDYPDGLNAPSECPRPVEVIWGWCNPLNYTQFTTPRLDNVTPQQIRDHTLHAIAQEFNSMTDPMEFHDKHKRRYNIIGRRKMIPNNTRNVPTKVSPFNGMGAAASSKLTLDINFPMMKKVNYTKSVPSDLSIPQFAYPNEAYLPFVFFFNPDYAMYDGQNYPDDPGIEPIKFKFNDCHWFNDA